MSRLLATTTVSDGAAAGEGAGGGGGGGAGAAGAGGAAGGAGGAGEGAGAGAGAAAAAAASGAGAGAGAEKAFYESYQSQDLRTHPSLHRFKGHEDVAKAYVELEKRFGIDPARRIDLPTDPNDAEGMRAVYSKIGLPEEIEGYGINLDDKATPTDRAMHAEFLDAMHKSGAPSQFVKAAHDWYQASSAKVMEAEAQLKADRAAAGTGALKAAFGAHHDARLREIEGFLTKYDPEGKVGLNKDTFMMHPEATMMLSRVLDAIAEPGTAGGQTGDAFRGGQTLTPSMATAELRKLEADPVKGKALMDRDHPMHKSVVAERSRLLYLEQGKEPPAPRA